MQLSIGLSTNSIHCAQLASHWRKTGELIQIFALKRGGQVETIKRIL